MSATLNSICKKSQISSFEESFFITKVSCFEFLEYVVSCFEFLEFLQSRVFNWRDAEIF